MQNDAASLVVQCFTVCTTHTATPYQKNITNKKNIIFTIPFSSCYTFKYDFKNSAGCYSLHHLRFFMRIFKIQKNQVIHDKAHLDNTSGLAKY